MESSLGRPVAQSLHAGSTILVCSPVPDTQTLIRSVLCGDSRKVYEARSIREAFRTLARDRVTAIICQDHLPDGSWQDLQSAIALMPDPPNLLVLSDTTDEGIWPEALNLGAYDVLMTPLNASEVLRLTGLACQHFHQHRRREPAAGSDPSGPGSSRPRQKAFAA